MEGVSYGTPTQWHLTSQRSHQQSTQKQFLQDSRRSFLRNRIFLNWNHIPSSLNSFSSSKCTGNHRGRKGETQSFPPLRRFSAYCPISPNRGKYIDLDLIKVLLLGDLKLTLTPKETHLEMIRFLDTNKIFTAVEGHFDSWRLMLLKSCFSKVLLGLNLAVLLETKLAALWNEWMKWNEWMNEMRVLGWEERLGFQETLARNHQVVDQKT